MTDIEFGRLTDLPLRDAWKHEARQFTPWLADNIASLSDVIGLPLEITGTEVAVGSFAADILARNPLDDTVVLIENQLEMTDHTHLGQIMTYLAGLEAHTVVWMAPKFREPHLSAIRWLNEHTADGFSFFAVKVRVVRIGDSPFAPIFEVLEKPSDWERALQLKVRPQRSELSAQRQEFWAGLLALSPELGDLGLSTSAEANKWLTSSIPDIVVGLMVASDYCGLYVRGRTGLPIEDLEEILAPILPTIATDLQLSADLASNGRWYLTDRRDGRLDDRDQWPLTWDWMAKRAKQYLRALERASGAL